MSRSSRRRPRPRLDLLVIRLVGVALVLAPIACGGPDESETRPSAASTESVADHPGLAEMYEADQTDRTEGRFEGLAERDRERKARVDSLIEAGALRTANDHYHAAMISQHGESAESYLQAHELAKDAVELDPDHDEARWLSAAAWDLYMMETGQPQWYGTQIVRPAEQDTWRLYDLDTTRVTDADRARLNVPPLSQMREQVRRMNHPE